MSRISLTRNVLTVGGVRPGRSSEPALLPPRRQRAGSSGTRLTARFGITHVGDTTLSSGSIRAHPYAHFPAKKAGSTLCRMSPVSLVVLQQRWEGPVCSQREQSLTSRPAPGGAHRPCVRQQPMAYRPFMRRTSLRRYDRYAAETVSSKPGRDRRQPLRSSQSASCGDWMHRVECSRPPRS